MNAVGCSGAGSVEGAELKKLSQAWSWRRQGSEDTESRHKQASKQTNPQWLTSPSCLLGWLYFPLYHLLLSDMPYILSFDLLLVCVLLSRRNVIVSTSKDFRIGVVAHLQPQH